MEPLDGLSHFVDALRIKTIAGLIQYKKLRLRQKGLRQRQSRPHPVGVCPHPGTLAPLKPNPINYLLNAGARGGGGIGTEDLQVPQTPEVIVKGGAFENSPYLLQC